MCVVAEESVIVLAAPLEAASPPPAQACSGGAGDSTHSMWMFVKMRPVQSAVTDLEHVTNPVCHKPHLPVRQQVTEGENRGRGGGEEGKKNVICLFELSLGNLKGGNFRVPRGVS